MPMDTRNENSTEEGESGLVSELDQLLHQGWQRVECGGEGECGYLTIAQGRAQSLQKEHLPWEAAQRMAASLRANVFQHIKKEKHYKRYAEFFAKDPSTDSQQASTFDEWLQISNKKGAGSTGYSFKL